MWPLFVYMTKEECFRALRNLELEAYSMLVSAMRAQGPLTSEKRRVLKDVCRTLHINTERHKCEVRRAVNDEKLNTIAYQLNGPMFNFEDWCQEGRRMLPMMQRISPQTLRPILSDNVGFTNNEREADEEYEEGDDSQDAEKDLQPDHGDETSKDNTEVIHQNHKVMIVSNSESIPTTSILHKTLSVPFSKVTKINLENFKIVPSSFSPAMQVSSGSANKSFISGKGGKRIIPISQLQVLNHKLGSKSGIKVLPISSKIFGKNITMKRIGTHGLKTSVLQPLVPNSDEIPPLSKIKVENVEIMNEITSQNEDENYETKEKEGDNESVSKEIEENGDNQVLSEPSPKTEPSELATSFGTQDPKNNVAIKEGGAEDDDLASLMEIDSSEFIEPEMKEAVASSKV